MVSQKLRHKVLAARSRGDRQYEIARKANVHPTVLSAILNGAIPIRPGDIRVIRIGEVLGVSAADCFEEASRD